ncbi:TniQ family protein [Rhodobacteraceae bacterium]|nr:TniQ family protein [Paracoccaceae bacterium]
MTTPRLGLTLSIGQYEPAIAYASRLARLNGCTSLWSFCMLMGISAVKLGQGDSVEIEKLSHISGTSIVDLERFSMKTVTRATRSIGGQVFPNKAIKIQTQHICPACILDQIDNREAYYGASDVFWYCDFVRTCPKHNLLLVPLCEDQTGWFPYDFAARLCQSRPDKNALLNLMVSAPTDLDQFSIASFSGVRHQSWLKDCDAYAVSRASEKLGCTMRGLRSVKGLSRAQLAYYSDLGFHALSAGPEAFAQVLNDRVKDQAGRGVGQTFGIFHIFLNSPTGRGLPQVRDVLRTTIIENFLVEPGDTVLGEICTQRRYHSLQSAADEVGLHPIKVASVLRAAGLLPSETKSKPMLIEAERCSFMLQKLSTAVFTKDAIRFLGMPWRHLVKVKDAGLISPINPACGGNYLFCQNELTRLRNEMCQNGVALSETSEDLVPIYKAANQAVCGIAEVVKLLVSSDLKNVGLINGDHGFDAIRVDPIEVFKALPSYKDVTAAMTREELLTYFGVCKTTVAFLIREGHFDEFRTRCRKSRKVRSYITNESVGRFSQKYISLRNLALHLGVNSTRLSFSLEVKELYELPVPERCRGRFFRRADVLV